MQSKKLLVLDLDETLIHSSEKPLSRVADFRVGHLHVYKRPYVHEFIAAVLGSYELAVWTAADHIYAATIVAELFPRDSVQFILSRQHCIPAHNWETREDHWIKDIKRLRRKGYATDSILVVDDTASGYSRSYGNLVVVQGFVGDANDDELKYLSQYLERLTTVQNVRAIEKRNWRLQVLGRI